MTLSDLIRQRRWSLIVYPLVFAALGLTYAFIQHPVYESTATIIFPRESGGAGSLAGLLGRSDVTASGDLLTSLGLNLGKTPTSAYANSVLTSRSTAEDLVDHFHLQEVWHSRNRDDAILRLKRTLAVVPRTKEPVLDLTIRIGDAQLAADILNRAIENYRHYSATAIVSSAKHVRLLLEAQLKEHQKKLKEATQALVTFEQTHDMAWMGEETGERMAERALTADNSARVGLEQTQARIGAIRSGLNNAADALQSNSVFPVAATDPILESLQTALINARLHRDELRISRTPANLELRAAELQVRNVERLLTQRIDAINHATHESLLLPLVDAQASLNAARATAAAARAQLKRQVSRFRSSTGPHMQFLTLKRNYSIEEGLVRALNLELQKALMQEAADSIDIEVLDPPNVPIRPVLPRKGLYTEVGFAFGLLIALVSIIMRFLLNQSVNVPVTTDSKSAP